MPINDALRILVGHFKNFVDDHPHLVPVASEIVVGDLDIGIAGQFDQLFFNGETGGLELYDWKTNKKISDSNPFQNYKEPIDDLEECELNTYSLQLNLYKAILEKNTSLKIDAMNIVWFYENNPDYVKFDIPVLDHTINTLLRERTLLN